MDLAGRMGMLNMQDDIIPMQDDLIPMQASDQEAESDPVIRPMHAQQGTNQVAFEQLWQAMQARARELNIDLSHPANAAEMVHILQARVAGAQQIANQANVATRSSPSIPISSQPPSSLQSGQGTQLAQQPSGFTIQQLHVLKSQILAYRRIMKRERSLPQELLQAIAPPPLELQTLRQTSPVGVHVQPSG